MAFSIGVGRGLRADRIGAARELVSSFQGLDAHQYLYRSALLLPDALAGHADELVEEVTLLTAGTYQLQGHRPKAALFFDCVATRLRMGKEFGLELGEIDRLLGPAGYGQKEDQQRSGEAGFDLHLTKPVDFEELQRLLEGTRQGRR